MPDAIDEKSYNDKVRSVLRERGDDGIVERHTLHFIYPRDQNASGLTDFVSEYFSGIFGVTTKPTDDGSGLILEHFIAVAGVEFDKLTSKMREYSSKLQWDYDGWECALVTNDANMKDIRQ